MNTYFFRMSLNISGSNTLFCISCKQQEYLLVQTCGLNDFDRVTMLVYIVMTYINSNSATG